MNINPPTAPRGSEAVSNRKADAAGYVQAVDQVNFPEIDNAKESPQASDKRSEDLRSSAKTAQPQSPSASQKNQSMTEISKLSLLLQLLKDKGMAQSVIRQLEPLFQSGPIQPGQLAHALREAIVYSGIFYESQLSRYVQGNLSREDIIKNPQISGRSGLQTRSMSPNPEDVELPASMIWVEKRDLALFESVMRHQIDVINSPHINWKGDIWPGFACHISLVFPQSALQKFREKISHHQASADDRPVQAFLEFNTSAYGKVACHIQLKKPKATIFITVEDPELLRVLRNVEEGIIQRLNNIGVSDVSLSLDPMRTD